MNRRALIVIVASVSGLVAFLAAYKYWRVSSMIATAASFGEAAEAVQVLLASVPLALASALILTFLEFTTIDIFAQVGVITLVGPVAKNGILIVDFRQQAVGAWIRAHPGDP